MLEKTPVAYGGCDLFSGEDEASRVDTQTLSGVKKAPKTKILQMQKELTWASPSNDFGGRPQSGGQVVATRH